MEDLMILSISYDLHNHGRDYDSVIATIKTATSWAHPQGSLWLVDTTLSPEQWVAKLRNAGDQDDEYFVCRLAHNWWSQHMDKDVIAWLKSPSRNW